MQGIKLSLNRVGAHGDITLLSIVGYIDTTTSKELTRTIQELIKKKHYQIVADLGGVSYISSAGWGVFMGEIKNILEKGGDLKIVQMTAEVFEVFEMLEFNRILNYYDTVEEAIDEFDILRGINLSESKPLQQAVDLQGSGGDASPASGNAAPGRANLRKYSIAIDTQEVPIVEKIKRIVIDNPLGSTRLIQQQLNTEEYGFNKIGWFKVRSMLKDLNLETKEKRYRFYRSR
ncbi:STAS domain-containing protein [bacterium]|nr:STAS domain-containing protein [bacterium]